MKREKRNFLLKIRRQVEEIWQSASMDGPEHVKEEAYELLQEIDKALEEGKGK